MDSAPDLDTVAGASVVVIGGGFGGLSVACYLADAGADVTVIEKNDALGGVASTLERDGFRFDLGPTRYLLPEVFERFFGHFDRSPDEYYAVEPLDPHCRIFWKDGDSVDVVRELETNKETFEGYERGGAAALHHYLETAESNYEVGMEHVLYEDRNRFRDYVDVDILRRARGRSLARSIQGHVEDYVGHPKLQQLLQRWLLLLGGSPAETPAMYSLLSYDEFSEGVNHPRGGMGAVVDGIVELGAELGVDYATNAPVSELVGTRGGFAVRTTGGREFLADVVVSDADYAHTEQELLPREKRQYAAEYWESRTYAPSAFQLHLGVDGDVDPLAHHSFVFPTDWDGHFDRLSGNPEWPDDPSYYVCVPSRTDDDAAPEGRSALSVLVPIAPGVDDTRERRAAFRDRILADLADNAGVDLRDRVVVEESVSVDDYAQRYNSYRGSAFGLAHTLQQTTVMRPPRRSSAVDGLYFAGSDTKPGIGVPACLISGLLTAEAIAETS